MSAKLGTVIDKQNTEINASKSINAADLHSEVLRRFCRNTTSFERAFWNKKFANSNTEDKINELQLLLHSLTQAVESFKFRPSKDIVDWPLSDSSDDAAAIAGDWSRVGQDLVSASIKISSHKKLVNNAK